MTVAVIGIALHEIASGYAVVGGDDHFGLPLQGIHMGRNAPGQGPDVGRLVVIGRSGANRRLAAHLLECAEGLVVGGGACWCGVLGVEGGDQDAVAALFGKGGDTTGC